jgi:D-glycero-alpha-D-manno-heptose-7-phosphate kinase
MLRYLPPFFDYKYHIRYRKNEKCNKIEKIKHPSVMHCLKFMNIEQGIELVHAADLPARSGVGSSSAFTVALLHAINALQGKMVTKRRLALDAIHIEQDLIGENIGFQDQTAAAFGGLNRIDYDSNSIINVSALTLKQDFVKEFEQSFMLFFTGFSRTASEIAGKYVSTLQKKSKKELKEMYDMVNVSIDLLNKEDINSFGKLMHESWKLKKTLYDKISNEEIDNIYSRALKAGANGGKLCGAGGGGFLLLSVPKEKQLQVKLALKNLLYVPFKFDTLGSQVIMYHQQDF